jgi:predicted transcriptional regulator
VVTQDGKARGRLLSTELDQRSERARFVSAVEEGLADADVGRVSTHDEVAARMRERFHSKRTR